MHGWLVAALLLGLLGDLALSFAPPAPPIGRAEPRVRARSSRRLSEAFGPTPACWRPARPAARPARAAAPTGPGTGSPSDALFSAGLPASCSATSATAWRSCASGWSPVVGFGLVLVLLALFAFG